MKKNISFFLFMLCLSIANSEEIDSLKKIDTTFYLPITDINFDGSKDTLLYQVKGQSWRKPFTISFTVKNRNKIIYTTTYVDSSSDEMFHEQGSLDFCDNQSYQLCKKKWYYETLVKNLILFIPLSDAHRSSLFDTLDEMAMPSSLKKTYSNALHVDDKTAFEKVKVFLKVMEKHELTLFCIPPNPLHPSFPSVFDPTTKSMVMILSF